MLTSRFCVLFLGSAVALAAAGDVQGADPREQPDTALLEMVRVMEANDVAAYFRDFAPPREINLAMQNGKIPLDEAVKGIAKQMEKDPERARQAAADLKKALLGKPKLSADGQEATFIAPKPAPYSTIKVVMRKEGKFWRAKEISVVLPKSNPKAAPKGKITSEKVEPQPDKK